MKVNDWEYIGDGVYIMCNGAGFILHANSHDHPTDVIYLEPEVCLSLIIKLQEHIRR